MLQSNIIVPFATKEWFWLWQRPLLFLLNNPSPKIREYFRDKIGITHHNAKTKLFRLTPNAAIYQLDKEYKGGAFYSGNHFEWNIKNEFERFLMPFHNWDIGVANRFAPALNLGLDTLTAYSTTADGYVKYNDATFSTVQGAATGSTVSTTASSDAYGVECSTGYYIGRSFFYFDTSAMGSGQTVSASDLRLYTTAGGSNQSICCQEGRQAATLTTVDYDSFTGSEFGTKTSSFGTGYNTIAMTSGGFTLINNNSNCKICVRQYANDYSNSAPGSDSYFGVHYSNYTGTTRDPYLYVTYSAASPASNNIKMMI